MSSVGRLIALTRQVKGRSISDLAKATGRSEGHLERIENGMLTGTPETLLALARQLGISQDVVRDAYVQDARDQALALWNWRKSVKPIVKHKDRK